MKQENSTKLGWKFWLVVFGIVLLALFIWFYQGSAVFGETKLDVGNIRVFLIYMGAVVVAPIGLYLTAMRTNSLDSQVKNDAGKLDNDRRKTINEAFAKSIELLGNDKDAVRQGAIFSLQRLMREEDLYPTIMRILVSFVRDRTVKFRKQIEQVTDSYKTDDALKATLRARRENEKGNLPLDVEAALLVIQERKSKYTDSYENKKLSSELEEMELYEKESKNAGVGEKPKKRVGFMFDVSNSYFLNIELKGVDFRGFNLSDCIFKGCGFVEADFERAYLVGTDFGSADLTKANFKDANIEGNDPELRQENKECDLSKTTGLTQDQINAAFGNEFTLLPDGLKKPAHWSANTPAPADSSPSLL